MASIILAGGRSSRLGIDKTLIKLGARTVLEMVIETVKKIDPNVYIITNDVDKFKNLEIPSITVLKDKLIDQGPLVGILTGLEASSDSHNIVVSCDIPFIRAKLLRYLYNTSSNFDVTVASVDGVLHPLFGVYSKRCIQPMSNAVSSGHRKVTSFFTSVNVKIVYEDTIIMFDSDLRSFFNINNQEDLEQAYRLFDAYKEK